MTGADENIGELLQLTARLGGSRRPPNDDNPKQLSAAELTSIDHVCLQFESALQRGDLARIEDYVNTTGDSDSVRLALIAELMALEIDYRQRSGKPVLRNEYEARFPNELWAVEKAFESAVEINETLGSAATTEEIVPGEQLEIANRYTIQRFHARGGLGVVYTARDESLARQVAVKFPRHQVDSTAEGWRLEREAAITGRLEHPGIVPVYAVHSAAAGRPCYVMKFVEGETLQDAVTKLHAATTRHPRSFYQSLPFRQMLQRLIAICHTVAFAHGRQVIHRDIKPSNIMLGTFGETVLLDWGLAKPLGPQQDQPELTDLALTDSRADDSLGTMPGRFVGTPEFASPEQVAGTLNEVSQPSDVYSLGATLYFILTARPPIDVRESDGSASDELHRRCSSPRFHQPTVPRALESICRKAMAFRADDRYRSASELADDLERFLADESVTALVESWLPRARRWFRKNPARTAALAASVLVAACALIAGSGLLARKNRDLQVANDSLGRANTKLVEANDAASNARSQAMKALRTLTEGVIQRLLAQQASLSNDDRLFLQRIRDDYLQFAGLQASDPENIAIQTEGHLRVGQIHRILGQTSEARESFQRAIELTATTNNPSPDLRRLIAQAHGAFGELLMLLGDSVQAKLELRSAIDWSEGLAKEFSKEAKYRSDLASWHTKLGNVLRILEEPNAACDEYETSNSLLDQLAAKDPDNLDYTWSRACNHLLRAAVWSRGDRLSEADRELGLALDLQQEVLDAAPDSIRYQYDLSCIHAEFGTLHQKQKRFDEATKHLELSIDILARLVEAYPQMIPNHGALIESHYRLAKVFQDWSKFDQAESHFKRANVLMKTHADRYVNLPEYQTNWRNVHMHYAWLLQTKERFKEAEEHYREGIRIAEALAKTQQSLTNSVDLGNSLIPLGRLLESQQRTDAAAEFYEQAIRAVDGFGDVELRQPKPCAMLIRAHSAAGRLYLSTGKLELAAPHWQSVSTLAEGPVATDARGKLAVSMAPIDPKESLALVDELLREGVVSPTVTFNLACACGLASAAMDESSDRETVSQKSIELLRRARDQGYFAGPEQIELLQSAKSLDNLREREDFKLFVRELTVNNNPNDE